jgi:dihydrofolate reductase
MVSLIVAHANQNVIGFKGDMPWSLPADLKRLKNLTEGNTIVMGRNTLDTLGKPLPNRKNVVLTRNEEFVSEGVEVIHHIDEIKNLEGKIFIFGGADVYEQTMPLVDEMYITRIHETFAGDTFFPEYDITEWEIVDITPGEVDEKNRYAHEFLHLKRGL